MRVRSIGIAALGLLVASIALAGCAGSPPDIEVTSSATAPETQAPETPEPTEGATPVAAVQPFEGQCEPLLSAGEIAEILGEAAELRTPVETMALTQTVFQRAGGLSCSWNAGAPGPWVSAGMIPLAAFDDTQTPAPSPISCTFDLGEEVCVTSLDVGSLWLVVQGSSTEVVTAALGPIGSRLVDEPAEPASRAVDEWVAPPCEAYLPGMQTVFGSDVTPGYPSDNVASGPLWDAFVSLGRTNACGFSGLGESDYAVRFNVIPGVSDLVLTAGEDVTVGEADEAWIADINNMPVLTVRAGSNILRVSGTSAVSTEDLAEVAEILVHMLELTIPEA